MSKEIPSVLPHQIALLTTTEAASYLNLKPATLEQWRWNGRGPQFCKIGRACRYRIVDLNNYVDENVFTSTTIAQSAAKGGNNEN